MDGSLCSLGSVNIKAGTAAFFEDINLDLGVKVFGMVSSMLAELQAIVLALECVPSSSSIHLFSDSQAALDACHSGVLGNDKTDLLAGVSSHPGQIFYLWLKECFILANGNIVSGNSRHFVCDVFWSIHHASWEVGSGTRIVPGVTIVNKTAKQHHNLQEKRPKTSGNTGHLFPGIDWFKSFLVWHLNIHMAAGFTSCHSADSRSYFIKALHHKLPVAVRKHLYDRHYLNMKCLYCGNIELSDHVFSCAFDVAAWFQLFVDFVSTWKTVSDLSHASSHVSQMLSNCLADLELVALLYKGFVLVDWY
ncbi:hypothetical protein G9A89_002716 [Geosiphon pyriformis]|nr:hypothetical protein G9A89_002716 [Geosiphon pyriformis]